MSRFFSSASGAADGPAENSAPSGSTRPGVFSRWKAHLDLRAGVAAFATVVILTNTGAVVVAVQKERREAITAAVAQNSSDAAEFEQFTMRTLANCEAVAHSILREYARSGTETPLVQMRDQGAIDAHLFAAVRVVDEGGNVVASSERLTDFAAAEQVQREALAFHERQDTGKLFIGTPVRPVRFAGTRVPLSLRYNKGNGSFGGFVLLEIEPARFTDFAPTATHAADILALVGLDGITRARRMGGSSTAGNDFRASSLFQELATRDAGNTVAASPVDGVRRLFSFRRLHDYPLIVGAAVAETDALAAAAERAKWYYVRSVVLSAIIALLSGLVIRALSRRKRAVAMLVASEERLCAREEEFRSVTESMPQLVWITDAQGNHSYFNQQWIDYTGLSLAQSVGTGWVSAFHPSEQAGALRRWEDTVAKGEVYEAEYRLRAANGSYRWMLARALPLRDANQRTTRWFGTSTDIDNQVVAQARLREQANLLNLTRDAIIVREPDNTISFWNDGAERIYGWKADEVLGNCAQDFAYADSAKAVAARRQLVEEGEWSGEVEHLRKDGSTVTVNSRWTALQNDKRTASSVLVVNTDVTEHKKLQGQLLRTQRLESIGTLASGVAHDLNNILAPIMMAAPLLRADMSSEKRGQLVSLLEQSAERGAAIVRQVLTFARGADGERVLVQPSYSLREIADIAAETFPKSISVTADYPEDLALIEADPTQIHQILLNLCVNARDAMPDGGVLSLSAQNFHVDEHYAAMTPGLQAGPHLSIEVSDTGTGIPPHIMDKIFDPFFTTKGVGTGTGLGLSTVLGIVRDYGGAVNAESSGRGTTFRILLPASAASPAGVESLAAEELPRGRGETILVVDDEEAIRNVAERLLRASGYEVLLAEDGPSALAIFAAQAAAIHLVLTDIAMPVMGGIALARTLRKIRPDISIIVSAGREDDCSLAEMNDVGIVATLPKPYTQSALLRLLDQVISQTRKNP